MMPKSGQTPKQGKEKTSDVKSVDKQNYQPLQPAANDVNFSHTWTFCIGFGRFA